MISVGKKPYQRLYGGPQPKHKELLLIYPQAEDPLKKLSNIRLKTR